MKQFLISIILSVLLVGMVNAAVSVVAEPTALPLEESNDFLSITSEAPGTISVSTAEPITNLHLFINNTIIKIQLSLNPGETLRLAVPPGDIDIQARYLKEHNFIWERPSITKNDKPGVLKYVEYDKDKKRVEFTVYEADFIHKDQLATTLDSKNEQFTDYSIVINDRLESTCYPRITTGNNLYFSCTSKEYLNKLDVTMNLGIKEMHSVSVASEEASITPDVIEEEIIEELDNTETSITEEVIVEEEIAVHDDIVLTDTYKESTNFTVPITVFVILLFLTVMVIFFVASHHKHESKKAGTHHPDKKKK